MAEGIMALPPGAAGAPTGPQEGPLGAAAPYAAAKNTLDQMDPETLSREAFSAAAEVDPQEVNAFLQEIMAAGLTEEEIDQIEDVVEEVKAAGPEGYQEVREDLLAEGADPELLPPEYDPEFFTALAMAVYYLSSQMEEADLDEGMMGEDAMGGGIMAAGMPAPPPPLPEDTMTSMEGPVMPAPQNFAKGGIAELPSDLTSVTEAIRSMGRGGDTILAHINPEEARLLKARGGSGTINPMTGLPEFIFKAIGRAFKSIGRAVKKFVKSSVGRLITGVAIGTILGPAAATSLFGAGASVATVLGTSAAIGTFGSGILAGDGLKKSLISGFTVGATAYTGASLFGGASMSQAYAGQQGAATTVQGALQSPIETAKNIVGMGVPGGEGAAAMARSAAEGTAAATGAAPTMGTAELATAGGTGTPAGAMAASSAPAAGAAEGASMLGRAKAFWNAPSLDAFQNIFVNPSATTFLGKYAPAIGAGYIGLSASGAFTAPEEEPPGLISDYTGGKTSEQIMQENPEQFRDIALSSPQLRQPTMVETGPAFGFPTLGQTEAPTYIPTGISALPTAQALVQPYNREGLYNVPQMYRAADGSDPEGVKKFPRKNGHISGPGGPKDDKIPAMLSDGEFVFTAQSVRNMGGGSRRKGAARMYKMMKMLEGGPVGLPRST